MQSKVQSHHRLANRWPGCENDHVRPLETPNEQFVEPLVAGDDRRRCLLAVDLVDRRRLLKIWRERFGQRYKVAGLRTLPDAEQRVFGR